MSRISIWLAFKNLRFLDLMVIYTTMCWYRICLILPFFENPSLMIESFFFASSGSIKALARSNTIV